MSETPSRPKGPSPRPRPSVLATSVFGRGEGWLVLLTVVGLVPLAVALVLTIRPSSETHLGFVVALHVAVGLSLAGLLAAALSLLQRASTRLRALRDTAADFGSGDLSVRAPSQPLDDYGQLGLALNTMADRIGRLLQAQRDLLSGVSHELRSPLARIEVALELLRMELAINPLPSEAAAGFRGIIEEIQEEVHLLEQHIARLLEAQRVGTEGALPKRSEFSLETLLERVLHRERHRLNQLGWTLELDLQLPAGRLVGDENALDRAMSTLVENAVLHAGDGKADDGRVVQRVLRLETSADDAGRAVVRLLDRGPGLTQEQCLQVFEAFFRTDRSRSTQTGGTGLGLYLVKRIAEAHGGSARALPRPGGGLITEVRLPLKGSRREVQQTTRMAIQDLLEQSDS